ncbi:cytochrome P450 4V3 [Xylariaceae sp. FL0804]|nr:cytochrome P450 4V3 [Xylariaceae sp. FL0804]
MLPSLGSGIMLGLLKPLLTTAVAVGFMTFLGSFIRQGFIHRSRVRSLKAQGLPILPHSIVLGHLLVLAEFTQLHPPDVNIHVFHTWLSENCQKYFPGHDHLPPVVYLDLWPVSDSLAIVSDPELASQFTVVKSLPKIRMVKQYIKPLTAAIDIFCTEGPAWKSWRSILNPGFSNRNLTAMVPNMIEEVLVFAEELKKLAGENETWGSVFPLEQKTINLTFDVICRAALDVRLHEQSRETASPLKTALLDQLRLMAIMTNAAKATLLGRMPWHTAGIVRNNRTMHKALLPQVRVKLNGDPDNTKTKTIVDLAVESFNRTNPGATGQHDAFIDSLIANLKIFLFAGHDTTSSTICFMFKLLQDNPQALARLRKEHNDILGTDPEIAAPVLSDSPHLLSSLPYTLGVVKETLRLYPQAGTIRECPAGFCLTDASNTQWPMEGFGAWMSTPGIHRSPKYWPRPTEFLPERWTAAEGEPLRAPHGNIWIPFSIGPRNCIGMELAMMELKLVLALTARAFDVEEAWDDWDRSRGSRATPSHVINGERLYQVGISTVHPKEGMPVRVRQRALAPGA